MPQPNGIYHAHQVACMALDVVKACKAFVIPHRPKEPLVIRIGMHSGQSNTSTLSCCYKVLFFFLFPELFLQHLRGDGLSSPVSRLSDVRIHRRDFQSYSQSCWLLSYRPFPKCCQQECPQIAFLHLAPIHSQWTLFCSTGIIPVKVM